MEKVTEKGNNNKNINNKNMNNPVHKRFNAESCEENMTFEECELAILRHAVDETEKIQGEKMAKSKEIKEILEIVETFLIKKKLVCYGGTAINNILPKSAQFYDKDVEIPDYDFFSPNALDDAKELADIYGKRGYLEVEAKSGIHHGTFKVFVDFIPIADITQLYKPLFREISKESIVVAGIHYAPPNYLRMSMYLELSRPAGDVSRWEKVLKRLTLLNKFYPLTSQRDCNTIDFMRGMETHMEDSEKIYHIVRDAFVSQGVIFFGGYATSLYSRYMDINKQKLLKKLPDFDVLSEEPDKCALIVKEQLVQAKFKNVKITNFEKIGEIIPEHIKISVNGEVVAFIYKPIACHSYNILELKDRTVNVATIDTILAFYLAFTFANVPYYDKDRLLCMANFLFEVEQKNRLEQKGLLKRFSINCYGKQQTMEEMRAEKANKFKELMHDRSSLEFQEWFLKYNPNNQKKMNVREPESNIIKKTSKTTDIYKKMKSKRKQRSKTRKNNVLRNVRKSSDFLV